MTRISDDESDGLLESLATNLMDWRNQEDLSSVMPDAYNSRYPLHPGSFFSSSLLLSLLFLLILALCPPISLNPCS